MSLAFPRWVARGAVFSFGLAAVAACSSSPSSSSSSKAAPPPTSDTASSGFGFESRGVLEASPRQDVTIAILDPSAEDVSVFLDGTYADGSLSAGTASPTNGRATVTLHAPSSMATFSIHAHTASGKDARLDVAVSASGFADITVTANYTGNRTVGAVIGSVFLGVTCATLAASPLHDGSPLVIANVDEPFVISSVPAGASFAMSSRIGHYASGCVDVAPLTATVARQLATSIYDLPMALAETNLDAKFTLDPTTAATAGWNAMLASGTSDASGAFFASGSDASSLLDAMQAATPGGSSGASGLQFQSGRQAGNWANATTTWLGAHTPSVESRASEWLTSGATNAFGDLSAHLAPGPGVGLATMTLSSFAGFDAKSAGLSSSVAFGWVADSSDVLHLSGTVLISPSALIAAAADARAAADVSGATDVPSALASEIDCAGLASSLVGSGTCYSGCNADCTGALCASALSALWQTARNASSESSHTASIDLAASAKAIVGDDAAPISFSGSWTGNLRAPSVSFSIGGVASGSTP